MAEGEMITENLISSKARPVARNLKVNVNLTSTDKESLITIFSGQIWSYLFEQFIERLLVHMVLILVVRFSMSLGYFTQQVQISVFSISNTTPSPKVSVSLFF
jgi:hypothetical protein